LRTFLEKIEIKADKPLDHYFNPEITKLDLSDYELTDLPPEITNLKNLTELGLEDNKLKDLPPEIGKLTNLKELDLSSNEFTDLPSDIAKLTNLKVLDLRYNELTNLPSEIGNLTNLKRLNLAGNKFTDLPPEIGNLTNLKGLNIGSNPIIYLPDELKTFLEKIDIRTDMPLDHYFNSKRITKLGLSDYELRDVPSEIGKLTNLKKLSLEDNKLTELPSEIGKLTNLTRLDLSRNIFADLPPEIGKLTNLTRLDLSRNVFADLPPEIGKLTNLTKLDLKENHFTTLPSEIQNFTNLRELNLIRNESLDLASVCNVFPAYKKEIIISTDKMASNSDDNKLLIKIPEQNNLPTEIGKLTNLTVLDLRYNELSNLPAEMNKLPNLRVLDLMGNENLDLASVSNVFAECNNKTIFGKCKKEIIISTDKEASNSDDNTRLIKIPKKNTFPTEIGKLTNLTELDLTGNENLDLASVCNVFAECNEKTIFGKCKKEIIVSTDEDASNSDDNTRLIKIPEQDKKLPAEIKQIPNLTRLNLQSNNFSREEKEKIEQWLPDCQIQWR
jgi:Leucine-rich repeat (LRR) protein